MTGSGLRASFSGLRASLMGLWRVRGPPTQFWGPPNQAWGETDKQMDGWTKNLPIIQDFPLYRGRWQKRKGNCYWACLPGQLCDLCPKLAWDLWWNWYCQLMIYIHHFFMITKFTRSIEICDNPTGIKRFCFSPYFSERNNAISLTKFWKHSILEMISGFDEMR